MKKLIIVGAGGFAREIIQIVEDINEKYERKFEIVGLLDDNQNALDGIKCNYRIIDSIENHIPVSKYYYVCGIANPDIKEKIMNTLVDKGAMFESIIHHTACVSSTAEIGKGLVAYPGAWIGANSIIGDFVTILKSSIGHDAVVGNYSTISGNCELTRGVILGEKCYLGCAVSIVPERRIGDRVNILAGSVVYTNVKKDTKVMGYPAKRVNI